MARYCSHSPSPERANEEEENTYVPVVSPTHTYRPHEGQQYMPLPTTRPSSSPLSFIERTPLLPSPLLKSLTTHLTSGLPVPSQPVPRLRVRSPLSSLDYCSVLNILDSISCTSFNAYACRLRSNNRYHVISRCHDIFSSRACLWNSVPWGYPYSLFCTLSPLVTNFAPFNILNSTIVAQLVYSTGPSGFAAANGSMMIEVVIRQTDPSITESPGLTFFLALLSHNGHAHCQGQRDVH